MIRRLWLHLSYIILLSFSGLQFLELEKKNVWHEEVQEFSVVDLQSREVMGFFYLDAFSR